MKKTKTSEKILIIEPGKTFSNISHELWQYRELFFFLAWRDVIVRYKQTIIGFAWNFIRPLSTILVFTVIFGKIAKLSSGSIPYPLLVCAGTLPWQFFANALGASGDSIVGQAGLISKIYFPRLILPTSKLVLSFIDFSISFVILIGLMLFYHFIPSWRILTLPFFLFLAAITALGIGLWFSSLNVKYRDFAHILPFIIQFGLYISPVGFSSTIVPEKFRLLYSLNPLVGVIDGFRWAILGQNAHLYLPGFILSIIIALLLLISGLVFFQKTERAFADYI